MQNTALAQFPFENDFENDSLKRTSTVVETFVSAIKAWIVTRKGSRVGNMVGCFLPDLIGELVGYKDLSGLAQRLKTDATVQFPGVDFVDITMNLDFTASFVDLIVKIVFTTSLTDLTELEIILPTGIQTHN